MVDYRYLLNPGNISPSTRSTANEQGVKTANLTSGRHRLLGFEKVIVVSRFNDGFASEEDDFGQLDEHCGNRVESDLGISVVDVAQIPSITRTKVFQSHANLYLRCNATNPESMLMNMTSLHLFQLLEVRNIDIG
jgi:hypothetical protein